MELWPSWMDPGTAPEGLSSGEIDPNDLSYLGPYEPYANDYIDNMAIAPPEGWSDSPSAELLGDVMPSGDIFGGEGEFTPPMQDDPNPFADSISTLSQFFPDLYPQE